jgi:hypothetical protein
MAEDQPRGRRRRFKARTEHERKELIVHAIERWVIERGRPPRASDWTAMGPENDKEWPGASYVYSTFGTWDEALEAAGLAQIGPPGDDDELAGWVLASIRRWTDTHGEPPRWNDWRLRQPGWPTAYDVRRTFGTLTAAVEAAGLVPRQRGETAYKDAHRAEIVNAIRRWTEIHGRPPRRIDWDPYEARARGRPELAERYLAGTWPRAERVKRLFGSWQAALEAPQSEAPAEAGTSRCSHEGLLTNVEATRCEALTGLDAPPGNGAAR